MIQDKGAIVNQRQPRGDGRKKEEISPFKGGGKLTKVRKKPNGNSTFARHGTGPGGKK